MTMAISQGAEEGAQAVICASTGNTSASAAAYAARAGITCAVLVPAGQDRAGQARPGARARRAAAAGRRQLRRLPRRWPASSPTTTRSTPGQLASTRSASRARRPPSFEIVDVARRRPRHPLPAGRQRRQHHRLLAGLPRVRRRRRRHAARPRMWGFQAAGAAPIVTGARGRRTRRRSPPRSGSATRRPGPRRSPPATSPAARSTPSPTAQILAAYRLLARSEARVRRAGVGRQRRRAAAGAAAGGLDAGQRVVCTVTGNGLKDPEWAHLRRARAGHHPGRRRRRRGAALGLG